DPTNRICRCTVATNLIAIASYYEALGQNDKRIAALAEAVEVRRRLVREEPEDDDWQNSLAKELGALADAVLTEKDVRRAKGLREAALEVLQKLRMLYDGWLGDPDHDQEEVAKSRLGTLIRLSDNAVLVGRDDIALATAEDALKTDPTNSSATMNRAHALMYL